MAEPAKHRRAAPANRFRLSDPKAKSIKPGRRASSQLAADDRQLSVPREQAAGSTGTLTMPARSTTRTATPSRSVQRARQAGELKAQSASPVAAGPASTRGRGTAGATAAGRSAASRLNAGGRGTAARRPTRTLDTGSIAHPTPDGGNGRASAPARPGATASAAGKRKKPGGHRRAADRRAFPTIPALAGVATLVAAASGAMTLHSAASTGPDQGSMPAGIALTVGQLQEARSAAAGRADRSRRGGETADPTAEAAASAAARDRAAAKERAAWESARTRELQAIERKAAGATDQQVFERVIQWVLPLRSYRLSSGFGQSGSMWSADHTGQDFAAPMGTPIRAVGDGEIVSAAYDGPYGNRIVLRHDNGTETWYCHMSSYEYRSGYVKAGTTIGYVGSTGNSTGPHLHFEVHPEGGDDSADAIDPLPWLRALGLPL